MGSVNVALLGFGTVGSGVYELIEREQKRLSESLNGSVNVVAVLVKDDSIKRDVSSDVLVTSNIDDVLAQPVDIIVDAIVGVEPAFTYLCKAINQRCHIITANKEMFAHKGFELKEKAKEHGVTVHYEATVAGGVPVIRTLSQLVSVNEVVRIEAILNGTSNYILSEMRNKQVDLNTALQEAQHLGYAEADPTNDIEGFDAFYKAVILAELVTEERVNFNQVFRQGITGLRHEDVVNQQLKGHRAKHIVTLTIKQGEVNVVVEPKWVTAEHPLYDVEGVNNGVVVTSQYNGQLKLEGPGAGKGPTASVIVEDLVHIYKHEQKIVVH
ncbi:homoserine dehydrogenase [Alkalibacillus haloalkaliphilus]|uniref:homoserine dehydrogenase n=1 Tax=Alkalibacillus haloalkaliphilus TaxID=94136 RepID=UPI002936BFD4|nr:homoserine dehydrogenase [Alkalibacillus haloalkaliphilus]MDV2581941.1 homoserine dehydrogenase [Alkalibacillus haloalkaliphilus]